MQAEIGGAGRLPIESGIEPQLGSSSASSSDILSSYQVACHGGERVCDGERHELVEEPWSVHSISSFSVAISLFAKHSEDWQLQA